jgi:3-oxoacyl-[acyl-carrier protein] reductase
MLMSVLESGASIGQYPELAGRRILITGLTSASGIDVARAFADHGCRLVLHLAEESEAADAVLEVLSQSAAEVRAYSDPLHNVEAAVRFAQTAAQAFGGLETVINLVEADTTALLAAADPAAIEQAVAEQLQNAFLITRVAANRMRLTWAEGLVINIVRTAPPQSSAEATAVQLVRAMLATATRLEAQQWANQGVRINAVAPLDPADADASHLRRAVSEPDIAALALYLASGRGRELSGLVFDAGGAAVCC